jgi:hypothetical protein
MEHTRSHFVSDASGGATLRFKQDSHLEESLEMLLCSNPLPSDFDTLDYNLSLLIDRRDISNLVFKFSYVDSSTRRFVRLMNFPLLLGFLVVLACYLLNSQQGGDPINSFFVLTIGSLGLLQTSPLGRRMSNSVLREISEIAFSEISVAFYRTVCLVQAAMIDFRKRDVPPWQFCGLLLMCGIMGSIAAFSKHSQSQTRTEVLLYRTEWTIENLDVCRIASLFVYAAFCFGVLLHMLANMDMRYWNRASLIVVLVLTPMALESVCEIHWTIYRWSQSAMLEISRNVCYALGGILLIFALTPVRKTQGMRGT